MGVTASWIGYLVAALFALGLPVAVIQLLPGSTYLEADHAGFTYCNLFRRTTVPWSVVDEFFIVVHKPVGIKVHQMVGFNFVESYDKAKLGRRIAGIIGKCEGALPDTYGKKAEDLAVFMNEYLARARTSGVEQDVSTVREERVLRRDDIVGARITDVHGTFEVVEGLNHSRIYFSVDSGITFELPYPGFEWVSASLPPDAEKLEDEFVEDSFSVKRGWFGRLRFTREPPETNDIVKKIKERPIRGVFCRKLDDPDDVYGPDPAFIVFEDGDIAYCMSVAPNGISTGVFYRSADEVEEMGDLVDVFDLPITMTEAEEDGAPDRE